MLGGKGQTLYVSTSMKELEEANQREREQRSAGAVGKGTGERLLSGYQVPIWGDEKFLELDGGNSYTVS